MGGGGGLKVLEVLSRGRETTASLKCALKYALKKAVDAKSLISEETASLFHMFLSIIIKYLLVFSLLLKI